MDELVVREILQCLPTEANVFVFIYQQHVITGQYIITEYSVKQTGLYTYSVYS